MNTVKNVTQTVSFLWAATGYEARWAEEPEDVPVWDVSRDFPLEVGMERAPRFKMSSQLELLRYLLKVGHKDYRDAAASWEPLPAPDKNEKPSHYPRLVRATLDHSSHGCFRTNENVLKDIGKVTKPKYITAWRDGKPVEVLKNKILKLNEKYGSPHRPEDNTLENWLKLIVQVQAHTKAFSLYRTDGIDGLHRHLIDRKTEIEAKRVIDEIATARVMEPNRTSPAGEPSPESSNRPFEFHSFPVLSHDIDEVGRVELLEIDKMLRAFQAAVQSDDGDNAAFRRQVANNLYSTYDLKVSLTADGIIAKAGLGFWVSHKLSEHWLYGGKPKACANPNCRQALTSKRPNSLYCSDACKQAKYQASPKGRATEAKRRAKSAP